MVTKSMLFEESNQKMMRPRRLQDWARKEEPVWARGRETERGNTEPRRDWEWVQQQPSVVCLNAPLHILYSSTNYGKEFTSVWGSVKLYFLFPLNSSLDSCLRGGK